MPRGPRTVYENAIIVITSRSNNKRIIFRKKKDYKYFKKLLAKYKFKYKCKIYHYCLMRNHIHMMVKIAASITLSKIMQGLQLAYFHYYRRRYGYIGRFWQGRFHSKIVKDDKYLITAGLYIERNPVKAGLISEPEDYEWSSYCNYAYGRKDSLIDTDPCYLELGHTDKERQENYRRMMRAYIKNGK